MPADNATPEFPNATEDLQNVNKVDLVEAGFDLACTDNDLRDLDAITSALQRFIYDNRGENRLHLKPDLFKYESYRATARRLKKRIQQVIENGGVVSK